MGIRNDNDVFSPGQYEDVYYEAPIIAKRAPRVSDKYEIGKVWIDKSADDVYFITNVTAGSAVWINAGGGTGVFASITATTGDITATLGNLVSAAGTATLGGLTAGTMRTSAAGVVSALADGTAGQLLIGATGAAPAWGSITSASLVITPGVNTLNIEESGGTANSYVTTAGGPVAPLVGVLNVLGYDANITTDGAVANTVRVRLADDVTTVASLTASIDFDMLAGVCTIVGSTDVAQSIYLHANGGVTETIDIHSDLGTAVNSVNIHSDVGGLTLASGLATTDAINITATAGGVDVDAADQINITCTENAADAIVISASSGGIDITAAGIAGEDIDISNTASINLVSTEDAAEAIYLHANGGVSETIRIHSDLGTSATSIDLDTDVGGMTFTAGLGSNDAINIDATNGGVDVDAALQINLTSSQAAADAIVIDASDAAGGLDIDYGTGGCVVTGANGAFTLITGTGNILLGADAVQHNVTVGNVTGTSAVTLNSGTGGVAINTTGAGDFVVTSADTVLIDSAGVLELNSSAGIIGIGNDAVAQNINIGIGAAARVITIGNITDATQIALNAGTGGIGLVSTGTGDITIDSDDTLLLDADGIIEINSSAGTIDIGSDADNQAIRIGAGGERTITIGGTTTASSVVVQVGTGPAYFGANATEHATIIGSTSGASAFTAQCGTGDHIITAGGILDMNVTGLLTIDSTGGAISIGAGADAQAVNLGTGAAARVVTVGSVNTTAQTIIQSGTGDLSLTSTDAVTIDGAGVVEINSSAGIIGIGNDAVAQNINIGTGAAARTITVGNATSGTNLVLTGGDTGAVAVTPVTASVGGVALTCSGNVGVATFTGQTTASAAAQEFTITNTTCTVGSAILVSASNLGANDAQMTVTRVVPAAGSFVVTLTNNGAAALNGDVIITFWIVAA